MAADQPRTMRPMDATWVRGMRVPQPGALVLGYRYDPATVGQSISPNPPTADSPADVWWVVRRHLRPVAVPDGPGCGPLLRQARRVALLSLGAPRSAVR